MAKRVFMIFKSIVKFIPALFYSIVILALFYWQFNTLYGAIITHYTEEKLSILYGFLFIYLFSVLILTTTLVNLLHYLLKSKAFVSITLLTLLIFYGLSFREFYHIIAYFIHYPLPSNALMGIVFFIILTFGYALYSMVILYFKARMPLSHIVIFFMLGMGYSLYFIEHYCQPLEQLFQELL